MALLKFLLEEGVMVLIGILISVVTCIAMIYTVIKNYSFSKYCIPLYPFVALAGAVLMLVFGVLPVDEAVKTFTSSDSVNPLKIIVLFFSMSALSIYLDEAGFFEFLASVILRYASKKQIYLFLILYALVSFLTVFTSNDIVILTFTPFICCFCKNAGISPLPYLIEEFVAANTFSMLLVIGNPTNIYLSLASGIGFAEYFATMCLPTLAGGAAALAVMLLIFSKQLKEEMHISASKAEADIPRVVIGAICLGCATVALALSDLLPFEMWQVALFFVLLLFAVSAVYKIICGKRESGIKNTFLRIPWLLFPFVSSMFIIVSALYHSGVCAEMAKAFDACEHVFSYGILSTIFSNIVNNIPMSVLFASVAEAGNVEREAIYATVIGSNLGAYLTPIGALAGIMWGQILREHNIKMTFRRFCTYGAMIVTPTLFVSLAVLLIL